MELAGNRKQLEKLLEITRSMQEDAAESIAKIELKLKYPQMLIYEAEVELLAVKRSLAASRKITDSTIRALDSLPAEEEGVQDETCALLPEQPPLTTDTKGRNNLSDEERERRRQRMKDMWTNSRMQRAKGSSRETEVA